MAVGWEEAEPQPWEKLDEESSRSYQCFTIYRDLGKDRSLRKAADVFYQDGERPATNSQVNQAERWSYTFGWVSRAEAYDHHLTEKFREEQEEQRRKMLERHATVATMFQRKIIERLQGLSVEELSPGVLARWLEVAVKVERLSRGEATERAEVSGPDGGPISIDMLVRRGKIPTPVLKEIIDAEVHEVMEILEKRLGSDPEVRAFLDSVSE